MEAGGGAASPINVTTNPLEISVAAQLSGRRAPQATIVVQQPSLNTDQSLSAVSTILLKNGNEFVSNVECGKHAIKKHKEDNMKQLLDVTNNLTLEEIHDFEMRWVDFVVCFFVFGLILPLDVSFERMTLDVVHLLYLLKEWLWICA